MPALQGKIIFLCTIFFAGACTSGRITVTGTALNDKGGAFVLVAKKGMFFIDGLEEWDHLYYGKTVRVSGRLKITVHLPRSTDSLVLQELVGREARLRKPRWRLVSDSSGFLP